MKEEDVAIVHTSGVNVESFQTTGAEATESPFWPKDRLQKWVHSEGDVLLVADANDTIVGYFLSHLHDTTGAAYIENLFVKEQYRRHGVGERLLREGVDRIVDNGGRYISVLTKRDNDEMQELLKKTGFNEGDTFVWMDRICDQ